MSKLYVAMVGLPARGKSTLVRRIKDGLEGEGVKAGIFNNGDVRRSMMGPETTDPEFYSPGNQFGLMARELIAKRNMEMAREFLAGDGMVAILDATNASRARRAAIEEYLTDYPVLFIECLNEDKFLQDAFIRRKILLPEYKGHDERGALENFQKRISYYESVYCPVGEERYWMRVDATANKILSERPCDGSPYYPAIRDIVTSIWVHELYLARHGQTEFNVEARIGGDPALTAKGHAQAKALAEYLKDKEISHIFTSTRKRSHQTAMPVLSTRPEVNPTPLKEFDELWAGDCEGMLYSEIAEKMPEVTKGRHADKYGYRYPNGESYADLRERVSQGLRRAFFLASNKPLMIVGHQAINRMILSIFLMQRTEDIPYIYIPQNQFYYISTTARRKLFELVRFT